MNETVFEKIEAAASVLKLDFSSEEETAENSV